MKREIDKWLTTNEKKIQQIAKSHIFKKNRNIDYRELISESYLNLMKNIDKVKTMNDVEAIFFNFIIKNTEWECSAINKGFKTDKEFKITDHIFDLTNDNTEMIEYYIPKEDNSLQRKELVEERFIYMNRYLDTIREPHKRIFFKKYIDYLQEGIRPTVRLMMKKYNLNLTSSHIIMREILDDLDLFLIQKGYKK